ncbi:hypothetical protein [Aquisalimonas sp.]|uniref:hypothetical protein n=1 Tax=unclassified Aquisalimonas TaxID=2644645 RepID=UPI0025C42B96|nr:hypothetical protein [Aquisalimonas sp.]
MRSILHTPDIARLTPGAFLRAVVARVWPFAAVSFLFAILVLLVPRTFDGTAVEWLNTLRPVNALLRELAVGSLLVVGGVVLILRQVPPGRPLLLFMATLSQAFITFFFYLAALFVGLLLGWPLAVWIEAPLGNIQPAVLGPIYGVLSVLLVYIAFALIHRLGAGHWPGEASGALFGKVDDVMRLGRLPDLAIRGVGAGMLIIFVVLFWTGAIL